MKKSLIILLIMIYTVNDLYAQVTNSSYVTQYKEKALQLSITVPMMKKDVWKLFTTDDGLKKWIAPVVTIDMKAGGWIKTNYDKTKSADDSSSIKLDIINYLEFEMITLKVNINNNFPAEVKAEDKNLQEILQFSDAGKGKTKITSTMVGWGHGSGWDKAYDFFEKGNDWTFNEILNLFKK